MEEIVDRKLVLSMGRICIVVLLLSSLTSARENFVETNQRLERRFSGNLENLERFKSNLSTVPNSNKIGLGYNPLYGSPVCYTGTCQMDGYGHRLFNLNYTQQSQGSCTDQLLPAHVLMLCLPSIEVDAGTEIIDTLDQLQKSTMKGFEISASAEYRPVSASYKYSSQTQYMIDNMIKSNQEILYTTVRISTMKLKLFAPFMTFSDEFQHTIENLPCCDAADRDTERYIFDLIFKYYGFTYIADLTLGGIAQQNIFINKTQSVEIEQKGYDKSHEASAAFYVSFSMKPSQSNNTTNQNEFMKLVKKTSLTKLGGDTSIQTFEEWSKTVPSNPAVIKLGVEYWFDLLDEKRFPNDKNILEKRKLIEQAFNKYVSNPVFCYSNCSSNGICQPTGYFQFGTCKCNEGWSGPECSNKVLKKDTHSGTLCGLKQAIACGDVPSSSSCPSNWKNVPEATLPTSGSQIPYKGIGLSFCSKLNTNKDMSKKGTICGLSYGSLSVRCDERNTNSEQCPSGYRRGEISLWGSMTRFCYKNNDTIDDRPGTICGLQTKISGNNISGMLITEVACDDYYPGRGSCPPGYMLTTGQTTIQAPFTIYTSATYNVSVSVCSTVKHETDIFGSLVPSIG